MGWQAGKGGRILIQPNGATVAVSITRTSGASTTVYSDQARTSSVAMPNTVSSPAIYWLDGDDSYTVSCKVSGIECAKAGTTVGAVVVYIGGGQSETVSVDIETAQGAAGVSGSYPQAFMPEAYGAVGDGTTDDTAAVQAAINAATVGSRVYFGRLYLVTGVTWKSGVAAAGPGRLAGAGMKLKDASNTHVIFLPDNTTDVEISGLYLDGNRAGQTVKCMGIKIGLTAGGSGCARIDVHDNHVVNANGYNIVAVGATRVTFRGNIVEGSNEEGLEFQGSSLSSMVGNHVVSAGLNGIYVWAGTASGGSAYGNTVSANVVDNASALGDGYAGIRIDDGAVNTTVTGNTVTGGGTNATGIIASSATAQTVKHVTIVGNTVKDTPGNCMMVSAAQYVTVSANTVTGSVAGNGIYVLGATTGRVVINSNTASFNAGDGIKIDTITVGTVTGNIASQNSGNGIHCTNVTNLPITGNVARGNTLQGIVTDGTSDTLTLVSNTATGNGDATYDITYTGTANKVHFNTGRYIPQGPLGDVDFPYTTTAPPASTLSMAANKARYVRLKGFGAITKVGLVVGTSSGNIRFAIYSNSGIGSAARPGAKKADSGTVACPATAYQEVALGSTVVVSPGDWIRFSVDNATATFGFDSATTLSTRENGRSHYMDSEFVPSDPANLTGAVDNVPWLKGVA